MGASRLYDLACVLDVPVAFFFVGLPDAVDSMDAGTAGPEGVSEPGVQLAETMVVAETPSSAATEDLVSSRAVRPSNWCGPIMESRIAAHAAACLTLSVQWGRTETAGSFSPQDFVIHEGRDPTRAEVRAQAVFIIFGADPVHERNAPFGFCLVAQEEGIKHSCA